MYDGYSNPGSGVASGDASCQMNEKMMSYSYGEILDMSSHLHEIFVGKSNHLSGDTSSSTAPPRIAFLCPPGPLYVAVQFASWSSGSIAVPLCISHKSSELAYVLRDCDPAYVVDGTQSRKEGRELRKAAREAGCMDRYWVLDDIMANFSYGGHQGQLEGDKAAGKPRTHYSVGADGCIPSVGHPALIIYTSGELYSLWCMHIKMHSSI